MGLSAAISASLAREFLSVSPEGGDELDPRMAVVTGLGTINPLGGDVASTWAALHESRCAVRGLDVSWLQGLELPVTIMLSAIGRCSRVTRRVARGAAIDQKIECAQATMMRAPSSIS